MPEEKLSYSFWCSWRFVIVMFFSLGCFNLYTLRANMSLALVCMVNHTAVKLQQQEYILNSQLDGNATIHGLGLAPIMMNFTSGKDEDVCNNDGPDRRTDSQKLEGEFVWDKPTQGVILSAFFWGYLFTQIPGGYLAFRFGAKWLIGITMFLVSILSFATPAVAAYGYKPLAALRAIQGILQGVYFPAFFTMYARWAVPLERSRILAFTISGLTMASIIVNPVSGLLCFAVGWPSVFYVFASISVVWNILWLLLVSDSPKNHRFISDSERVYIEETLQAEKAFDPYKRKSIPLKSILLSVPMWALTFGHTAATWGLYTMLTNLPTFLSEFLHLDIKKNGLYSALPYISSCVIMSISGRVADYLVEHKILRTINVRRLMQFLGITVPAIFLVGVGYMDCTKPAVAITLLTIGNAFFGFRTSGFGVSHSEIAPQYAEIIQAISNTIGTIPGIVAPAVIGAITVNQTQQEWQLVFWISLIIQATGCLVYALFIQAEVQPWAIAHDDGKKDVELTETPLGKCNITINT